MVFNAEQGKGATDLKILRAADINLTDMMKMRTTKIVQFSTLDCSNSRAKH